jgi:hypothetical protein
MRRPITTDTILAEVLTTICDLWEGAFVLLCCEREP